MGGDLEPYCGVYSLGGSEEHARGLGPVLALLAVCGPMRLLALPTAVDFRLAASAQLLGLVAALGTPEEIQSGTEAAT